MKAKIRRLENNLTTIGTGVIVFGIWTFIKFALSFLLLYKESIDAIDADVRTIVIIMIWCLAAVMPLIYLWLGISARAESKGKRKRIFYLIMLGILIIVSTLIILLELISIFRMSSRIGEIIITLIIDGTRMVFLIELMYSSIALRKLRKQQRTDEEGNV